MVSEELYTYVIAEEMYLVRLYYCHTQVLNVVHAWWMNWILDRYPLVLRTACQCGVAQYMWITRITTAGPHEPATSSLTECSSLFFCSFGLIISQQSKSTRYNILHDICIDRGIDSTVHIQISIPSNRTDQKVLCNTIILTVSHICWVRCSCLMFRCCTGYGSNPQLFVIHKTELCT